MADPYRGVGSFILFKEVLADELGHVYRAAELDRSGIRRTIWLRFFDAEGTPAAEVSAQADTVARIGEILQSTNVAPHPRLAVEGGVPALAVDHMPGQPLSLVLRKVRAEGFPVPVDNCLLILEKIALGLAAGLTVEVGGSPLIHGFLHPGLVLVTHDGEGLVTGFGVADQLLALLDTPAAETIRPYLAPEVLNSRTTTRRGDVYSLGAILFELLTGEPLPAQPELRPEALERAEMAYDEVPVPSDIKALLQRALAPRPEDRFSSAADFKKELDKLLYGGAYSPTTFNLALFMDRLFRSEIEVEERERSAEAQVDVSPFLKPEAPPVPEAVAEEAPRRSRGPGMWLGIAAGVAAIGVTAALLLRGGGADTGVQPTPTAQDLEAQRAAEQAKLKDMVEQELGRLMAEKEKEILAELSTRQGKIDELQTRLREMQQQGSSAGSETAEAKRSREALEQQLAAETAAKQQREKGLEEERQRALEEARRKAAAAAAATRPSPTAVAAATDPLPPAPTAVAAQQAQPPPAEPSVPGPITVTPNMFLDPSQVDTMPSILKESAVTWPRAALYSRRHGLIILQATVNAEGRVDEVKVLRADHDGFGIPAAATDAVRKYLFEPGTKDGVKVKTYATVTIPYRFQTR